MKGADLGAAADAELDTRAQKQKAALGVRAVSCWSGTL